METTTVIEYNDKKYKATVSKQRAKKSSRKSRLFVYVDQAIEDLTIGEHPDYGMRGIDLELDKAWDSYNRKLLKMHRDLSLTAFSEVGVELIIEKFTRKAGCTCPCSPGFILADKGFTYFVSIDEIGEN